uniref:Uncharacterized protein n=1 Tax=Solanum tuberosum TaxID=4113 RepID=M1DYL1_SOLTU
MEVVWHVWMPRREFYALHGNICILKELPIWQHHAWMIAWCVEGRTKRGGASEECATFGELENTSATRQSPLARVPNIANCPRSYKGENCSLGELKTIGHRQVDWAMVPRPPKVPVASQPRQGAEFLAEPVGRIAEPLGYPDVARPFRFTFGPSM